MRAPLRSPLLTGSAWRLALVLLVAMPVLVPLDLWRTWRAGAAYRRHVRLTRSTRR